MSGVQRIAFLADPHLAANEPGSQASFEETLERHVLEHQDRYR